MGKYGCKCKTPKMGCSYYHNKKCRLNNDEPCEMNDDSYHYKCCKLLNSEYGQSLVEELSQDIE